MKKKGIIKRLNDSLTFRKHFKMNTLLVFLLLLLAAASASKLTSGTAGNDLRSHFDTPLTS